MVPPNPVNPPISIKVKFVHPNAKLPSQTYAHDSGWDLTICEVIEKGGDVFFLNTGIALEPPTGFYVEVYPRSSIFKTNFIFANSVGIIDEDYRGPIMLPVRYFGSKNGQEEALQLVGQKFGQIIIRKRVEASFYQVEELKRSERDQGGFGSTGKGEKNPKFSLPDRREPLADAIEKFENLVREKFIKESISPLERRAFKFHNQSSGAGPVENKKIVRKANQQRIYKKSPSPKKKP